MPRATAKEISKSQRDHAEQHASTPNRQRREASGNYSTDSAKRPTRVPGAFGNEQRDTDGYYPGDSPRDKQWSILLKQVMAGARITVRM